mgnify:CR=1 FL=1
MPRPRQGEARGKQDEGQGGGMEEVEREVAKLRDMLSNKDHELAKALAHVARLEEEMAALREALAKKDKEVAKLEEKVKVVECEALVLEGELVKKEEKVVGVEEKMEEMEERCKAKVSEAKDLGVSPKSVITSKITENSLFHITHSLYHQGALFLQSWHSVRTNLVLCWNRVGGLLEQTFIFNFDPTLFISPHPTPTSLPGLLVTTPTPVLLTFDRVDAEAKIARGLCLSTSRS